jgi:thymidylate synthase ThyX
MPEDFKPDVYLLSRDKLSPETIAVTFAKTSRSPLSFREIAEELTDKKSAAFHEKWVVGYGHASVAEHAVLHIAFENVSRLAIECIESNRLASYTEKSTRYQKWHVESFHVPEEIRDTRYAELYSRTCRHLFEIYQRSLGPARKAIQNRFPQREGESEKRWDHRIRSHYVDACRFLLPAASLANVGMTVNARAMEHAVRKMLSHPLAEVRALGEMAKAVAQAEVPTLMKYVQSQPYLMNTREALSSAARRLGEDGARPMLALIDYDPKAEDRILAASLYPHQKGSFEEILSYVEGLRPEEREALAETILGTMGKFDVPLRALEYATYTFDVLLDQGAYFELKRHRMMTQTPQRLTAELGYAVPRLIVEAGIEEEYRAAMDTAKEAFQEIAAWNPEVAAYLVPNAFNRRVLMTLNLREVFHFCELRAAANAHFSIRRIGLRLAEMVREVHPLLASFMRLPEDVTWQTIEEEHFEQV